MNLWKLIGQSCRRKEWNSGHQRPGKAGGKQEGKEFINNYRNSSWFFFSLISLQQVKTFYDFFQMNRKEEKIKFPTFLFEKI